MWKKIGVAVLVAFGVLIAVIATRPSEFRVQRSLAIAAPPEVVFGLINDFHAWGGWSPWEKLDPEMKRTFAGAQSGVGANYAWTGNDQVGSGEMTIDSSMAPTQVTIALHFKEPFEATNTTTFSIDPRDSGANVTWQMDGQSDFAGKAMGLFMDMDAMVGGDFEKGLANMKQLAEAKAQELAAERKAAEEAAAKAAAEAKAKADAEAAALQDAELPAP